MEDSQKNFVNYVAGFLFNDQKTRVVLITKNRPDYLAGMLNGVGGKVEYGESLFEAMTREFHEETGLVVYDWNIYASIDDPNYTVHFFHKTVCDSVLDEAQTMTDEHIGVYDV